MIKVFILTAATTTASIGGMIGMSLLMLLPGSLGLWIVNPDSLSRVVHGMIHGGFIDFVVGYFWLFFVGGMALVISPLVLLFR